MPLYANTYGNICHYMLTLCWDDVIIYHNKYTCGGKDDVILEMLWKNMMLCRDVVIIYDNGDILWRYVHLLWSISRIIYL